MNARLAVVSLLVLFWAFVAFLAVNVAAIVRIAGLVPA